MQGDATFEVACDWSREWARVAMVNPGGAEVLIVFPFTPQPGKSDAEIRERILDMARTQMNAGLRSLLINSWPQND